MNRRHAHHRATPALTGGDDRPQGACVGTWEPFDVLIDEAVGARFYAARFEARAICRQCPVSERCLPAHIDEPWAQAVLGIDRDESRAIRSWAAWNGYPVKSTGPVSPSVRRAYYAAREAS